MIDAISRSTRWRVSMVRSSPEFVAGSNCTKSASCSSPHGHVPDVEKRPEAVVDPPRGEAMGRWQPVGLTEGLWREVAAPPPLAFSERPPSPWLRHRQDRHWQLTTPQPHFPHARNLDRTDVVEGKSVAVRVDLGGGRGIEYK